MVDTRDWTKAIGAGTAAAYRAYIAAHPDGAQKAAAATAVAVLDSRAKHAEALAQWRKAAGGRPGAAVNAAIEEATKALDAAGAQLKKQDAAAARRAADEAGALVTKLQRVLPPDAAGKVSDAQVACAWEKNLPVAMVLQLAPGVTLRAVLVPPGTFSMGSEGAFTNEKPIHKVTITRPFYVGESEVTNAQFNAWLKADPDAAARARLSVVADKDALPRVNVSWEDAGKFCSWLGSAHGREVRLPTEAEWEYACRAGSDGEYCFGDGPDGLGDYAWFKDNYGFRVHPVATRKPNRFGLYDMHGNVMEWCRDWYSDFYYAQSAGKDPTGPDTGNDRSLRGGVCFHPAKNVRSAYRDHDMPQTRNNDYGFRVVIIPK
jgi:formylglycine-generating enzyme required for sulfatase activity